MFSLGTSNSRLLSSSLPAASRNRVESGIAVESYTVCRTIVSLSSHRYHCCAIDLHACINIANPSFVGIILAGVEAISVFRAYVSKSLVLQPIYFCSICIVLRSIVFVCLHCHLRAE